MENCRLKTSVVILVASIYLSLTACNSEEYTNAQKPVKPLSGNTSFASQREAKLERAAEKLKMQEKPAIVEEATAMTEESGLVEEATEMAEESELLEEAAEIAEEPALVE